MRMTDFDGDNFASARPYAVDSHHVSSDAHVRARTYAL